MHDVLLTVASASAEHANGGLLGALGIDWKLLVEQALAFLILVAVLGKFVYPALIKAVEGRREQIEAGLKEAKESHEALARAETKVDDVLASARKDADAIIARSQQEAGSLIAEAEAKAKSRAEQIVTDARAQLDADVRKAREALKKDAIKLVAMATEEIIHEKLDDKKDQNLIKDALAKERA
jgi:F-type H+-transporting ATPase subunit b